MGMKRLSFIFLFLFALVEITNAQNFYSRRRNRTVMFSYGIGIAQYHGDLHDVLYDGMGSATGFSLGAGIRKSLGSAISLRFDVNYYQIGGDDAENGALNPDGALLQRSQGRANTPDTRFIRNLSFRSRNWEFALTANLKLIPVKGSYTRRPIFNPYIIAGIGFTTSNPKAQDPLTGDWVNLRKDIVTEPGFNENGDQSGLFKFVVPLGIGVRLRANKYIDVLIEGARRFTFTDYLDDVSTRYASVDDIRAANPNNPDLAVRLYDRSAEGGYTPRPEGSIRGNPELNDAYYIFQIRLEMYLPDNVFSEIFSPSRRKPKFR